MDITEVKSQLLDAALSAARRGWYVFPLRPGDKRPAFPNHAADACDLRDPRCRKAETHVGWEQRATTDPDRIRRAWATTPYNVGIACGPSGLLVVDLDMPKPGQHPPAEWDLPGVHDGGDVFALISDRANKTMPIGTYTVKTGRGGTHLYYYQHPGYYQHPDGEQLRNTSGTLGWLIDTRGWGGYVVAAGSVVDGRPYTTTWDIEPAPLDDWLADQLRPAPQPPQQPVVIDLGGNRRRAYLTAALTRQADTVTTAPEGRRNHALFTSACALGQLVAGGELTENDVTETLTTAAIRAGLTPTETARTITSGLRAGANRPRTVAA